MRKHERLCWLLPRLAGFSDFNLGQGAVTHGVSEHFFAQLESGAPFDLFLSVDMAYPRKLSEERLGADDAFLYAIGCIVVWVPKDSPVPVEKVGVKALLEPSVRKIAIANPEYAPYGRAAVAKF